MTGISVNYAQALYSLAKDEALETQILEQLRVLDTAFTQEPDYLRLLSAHNISKQERCDILDRCFGGKVHPYVLNFMKLLTEKGYSRHFGDCCKAYTTQYNEDNGILCVRAVSAVALTGEQMEKLTGKLESITSKKVQLKNRVDPSCLGGIRLDYDGKRLDGTVQHRLDEIGSILKSTVL